MNNKNTLLKRAMELEQAIDLENNRMLLGKNKYHSMGRPLVRKAEAMHNTVNDDIEKLTNTLFHRYEVAGEKGTNNKDNLTLLERGLAEGNEFVKLHRKSRRTKPAVVSETIETNFENVIPYDDKHERLIHYAEKYRIPFMKAGVKKSLKDLAHDIHKFEMKHIKQIMKFGLDKKYKEYGHYISLL